MTLGRWQRRAAAGLATLTPIVVALIVHLTLGWWTLGSTLQIAGACDELIGLAAVIAGIIDTRRRFTDRPGIAEDLKQSLKRVLDKILRRPKHATVTAGPINLTARAQISATGTVDDWNRLTTEERVERLRQRLDSETASFRKGLTDTRSELQDSIDAEAHTREQLDDELRRLIGNLAAGGLSLQTFGASAILVGLVVSIFGIWVG